VQKVEGTVCLSGTSKACTVAHVEEDGDESFVIKDAETPHVAAPRTTNHFSIEANSVHDIS
jgi:hypothetical protein